MNKIKVLPIYPQFPLTFWGYQVAVEYMGKKAVMPPTGLVTVMAMLPEDKFQPERIIDMNVEPLTDQQIRNSDIIFTSTMIVQENSHNEVLDRAHFYKKPVVAGGPFPTSYPERNSKANYIIGGEAEVALSPFLEDLLKGSADRIYTEKGVIASGRNTFPLTNTGRPDIKFTPLPRWDLLNLDNYFSAAIQFSRGCPFDCEFCDITAIYGREPRTKGNEQMIKEFDILKERGFVGSIFVVDDNFIGNKRNVRLFLPVATQWQMKNGYSHPLLTEASMDLAWPRNEDILYAMAPAGFDHVFTGIESVDDGVLKRMDKGQNLKMPIRDAVRKIQGAGLEVTAGFIVGSDEEKPEVFEKLFNFIQEVGIAIPMPGLLTALRETKLYKRLEKEGRLRDESTGNNTHHLGFNFVPQLDESFLIEGYVGLIEKLFDDKNYYQRCRILQENLGEQKVSTPVNIDGIFALGKSLRRQLFARGGWEYFKYLGETAIKQPNEFPSAVARAIKLDHFKTITRATIEDHSYSEHVESLYEHFRKRIDKMTSVYGEDIYQKVDVLRKTATRIIDKAERKYSKLHTDFRREAGNALKGLKERIENDLGGYLTKLS